MSNITIAGTSRPLRDANPAWINEQFHASLRSGRPPCVRVDIQAGDLRMVLQTPTCPASGGGGRMPNSEERKIFDLWNTEGLNNSKFTPREVIDFLERLRHIIR
jgi:hypothetical protein